MLQQGSNNIVTRLQTLTFDTPLCQCHVAHACSEDPPDTDLIFSEEVTLVGDIDGQPGFGQLMDAFANTSSFQE